MHSTSEPSAYVPTTPLIPIACNKQATQAYRAGHKALAKQLSARGREAAERMWAAHAAAAQGTLARRNRPQSGTLDLHGLHVSEALEAVRACLRPEARRRGGSAPLRIVVGEGRHSATQAARLAPAVKRLLTESGERWREPYAGLLEVEL